MEQEHTPQAAAPAQTPGRPPTSANGNDAPPIESVALYRRGKVVIPLLIVVIGIAAGVWYWYLGQRDFVSTDDAFIDADRLTISAKVLGRITDLAADAGDTVISGMTLVSLDSSDLHAQRLQSLATIHAMEANVAVAKVSIERAEEDFLRAQQQFTDKVIPKEVYDHAQKELQTAKVRCSAAEAQVVTAKSQLGIIAAQLLNLTVAAPIDGIVAKRWVMAGEVVQPGQPIYTLYDTKSQWITASFEETKLRTLHLGDVVQISVDAYPHVAFTGKVIQFGTNTAAQFSLIPPNNAAGNFTKITQRVPVKIAINPTGNPDTRLLPGMSVEVRVKVR